MHTWLCRHRHVLYYWRGADGDLQHLELTARRGEHHVNQHLCGRGRHDGRDCGGGPADRSQGGATRSDRDGEHDGDRLLRGGASAVGGAPHDIKGHGIDAYVTVNADEEPSDELRGELGQWVRKEIGPIASPDWLQWAPGLPKTRSGKIMRRILRKIAENDFGNLGDTSTLADPAVVEGLVENRMNR